MQATFACEKIQQPCPFIKLINKKTFEQLDQQKETFISQQTAIQDNILLLQQEIAKITIPTITTDSQRISAREQQQKDAEKDIENIKTFLSKIDYKAIEKQYEEYTNRDKQAKELEKQITIRDQEATQREEWKVLLQKASIQSESIQEQIQASTEIIKTKDQEYQKLEKEKQNINSIATSTLQQNHHNMQQYYHDIDILLQEFKAHQIEKKQLEEQESILNNLYTIFAKELLLIVLQDQLPSLNDIINSYLAQIVDYQISLQLNKSDADKIELEARIIDDKGMRDTKSLSGGQKIILKLIRMLAISSYINSPILFLDETINNLDTETISKVADILQNFVKQREMKFYTITHSQQIQEMDIRDHVIEIK